MKIDFNEIDLSILPNFKGGELEYRAKMLTDDKHKIMKGLLIPGASIGLHLKLCLSQKEKQNTM